MIMKNFFTALTFAFLGFTFSVLPPITRAYAEQCVTRGTPPFCIPHCEVGEYEKARLTGGGCIGGGGGNVSPGTRPYQSVCCKLGDQNKGYTTTGPVNPCEELGTGYEYSAKAGKCVACAPGTSYSESKKRCATTPSPEAIERDVQSGVYGDAEAIKKPVTCDLVDKSKCGKPPTKSMKKAKLPTQAELAEQCEARGSS